MAHNEDLPHSAINGQTPEGGWRREARRFAFCPAHGRIESLTTEPTERHARKTRLKSTQLSKP
ncbi:hypothetical protein CsSME_00005236 [Camellia sinensis var. sinensis]